MLTKLRRIDQWLVTCLLLGVLVGLGLLLWRTPRVRQLLKSIPWSKIIHRGQCMTPISGNNSISTTTQSASSSSTSAVPPISHSLAPPLSKASISSPTTIQPPLKQKLPDSIYHLFHPSAPFPIRMRGVVVCALWSHIPIIPASLVALPSEVSQYGESFGPWYMTRFARQLASDATPEPWIDEAETIQALTTMVNYVDTLANAQANHQGNNQQAQLVYQILHVRELEVKIPRFFRQRTYRLHYYMSKEDMQQAIVNVRRGFVLSLQKRFGLYEEDMHSGLVPSTFGHYDRNTHSRGWIVLNPERVLLVGIDTSDARILVGLLQRRDVDQTKQQKGIALDRYDDVLGRVSLWNAARDINEAVDRVANLVSSGQKATDGQVLISLALAVIGILVSLSSQLHFSTIHLWGTYGLLSLASILFWRHAHSGNVLWLRLGLLSIVCMLLLDIISI